MSVNSRFVSQDSLEFGYPKKTKTKPNLLLLLLSIAFIALLSLLVFPIVVLENDVNVIIHPQKKRHNSNQMLVGRSLLLNFSIFPCGGPLGPLGVQG